MTGWEITAIIVGVLVLLLIVTNLKDLYRYIKISLM